MEELDPPDSDSEYDKDDKAMIVDSDINDSEEEDNSDDSSSSDEEREWQDQSFKAGRHCADRSQAFHEFWRPSFSLRPAGCRLTGVARTDWAHETYTTLKDEVEKYRRVPAPKDGKEPKPAVAKLLTTEADRINQLLLDKGLIDRIWNDFVAREKVSVPWSGTFGC